MTSPGPDEAVFELTVAGRLGPALQAMFGSVAATTSCELHTTICLRCQDGQDLADIVQLFESRGIETTVIRPIT